MRRIRTIHHLAATGGTIMSKAIAAQPHIVLLSEIHPSARLSFSPFDPLQQVIALRRREGMAVDQVEREVFVDRLHRVMDMIDFAGGEVLVLRDHAHSDFMLKDWRRQSALVQVLVETGLEPVSIATIRDPIDSWLSSVQQRWLLNVAGFDDYCRRALAMIDQFPTTHIFRYEDFVSDPASTVQGMCRALEIEFDPGFLPRIHSIRLTGDSGRRPHKIIPLPRRPMTEGFTTEVMRSAAYREFGDRFGYAFSVSQSPAPLLSARA